MCWTCGSCDGECPINIASGRLRPRKIVRLANLGFNDELLSLPELWYCLTCRRCNRVCPMAVKPADLVVYFRREAVARQLVSYGDYGRYRSLFARFQNVRWHMVAHCLNGSHRPVTGPDWRQWLETPVKRPSRLVLYHPPSNGNGILKNALQGSLTSACFTCRECTGACPVSGLKEVFDPVSIFRMANLGMIEELLKLPEIWLCVACERCTDTCSQLVKGHMMIRSLQELAIAGGFVDSQLPLRIEDAAKAVYPRMIEAVDALFAA